MCKNAYYEKTVKEYIENNSTTVFGNLSRDHAKLVIETLFANAKESIRILSGTFHELFYNDLRKTIEETAKRLEAEAIKIITVEENDFESLKRDFDDINKRIGKDVIKYTPATNHGAPEDIEHFMVVDGMRYRIEDPHKIMPPDMAEYQVKARVCFNDRKESNFLIKSFDNMLAQLERTDN